MKQIDIKRIVSELLVFVLVLGNIPAIALATDDATGLCVHHEIHSDCGYEEGVSDCSYACEICNAEPEPTAAETQAPSEPDPTDPEPTVPETQAPTVPEPTVPETQAPSEPDATEEPTKPVCTGLADCAAEEHEDTCEKKLADEKAAEDKAAADSVATLIDALPALAEIKTKSLEDQGADYNQVQAAYAAYEKLTTDQKALLPPAEEVFKPYFDYFNSLTQEANTLVSDAAIEILKSFEGFSKYPYYDNDQWLVGYCTVISYEETRNYHENGITLTEADILLRKYLEGVIDPAVSNFASTNSLNLTQYQRDALSLFSYQYGTSWMTDTNNDFRSAVLQKKAGNEFIDAITQCQYGISSDNYNLRSIECRLAEANMYLNNGYSTNPPQNYTYVRLDGDGDGEYEQFQAYDSNSPTEIHYTPENVNCTFIGWVNADDRNTVVNQLDATTRRAKLCAVWKLNESVSGTCGENLTWKLTEEGILTISGEGDMTSRPWLDSYADNIKSVIIEDGVISICDFAFESCNRLTSINIPVGVTTIDNGAFARCSSLTSIVIPDGVTCISPSTFADCSSLTSITIPDSVAAIGTDAFSGCSSLTSIVIPDGIEWIGINTFYNCKNLTNIVIPDSVTAIGADAFAGCDSLTSVNIPASVTTIEDTAFRRCFSLTSFDVHDDNPNYCDVEGVLFDKNITTLIAFPGSHSEVYKIPSTVKTVGMNSFEYCELGTVTVPASVTSVESGAFDYFVGSLVFVGNAPAFDGSNFSGCEITAYYPEDATGWDDVINQDFEYGTITWIAYSDDRHRLDSNGKCVFCNQSSFACGENVKWSLADGVLTFSGTGAMEFELRDVVGDITPWQHCCDEITSVVIEDGITSISSYAFTGCNNIRNVKIGDDVEYICEYAFEFCSSLTSIVIPASVKSISWGAFDGCSSLKTIQFLGDAPEFFMGGAFDTVTATAYYPASGWTEDVMEEAGGDITWVALADEGKCGENLTWKLVNGVLTISGTGAMFDYDGENNLSPWYDLRLAIQSVVIEDGVTTIGYGAFYLCENLTSVSIPNSVTSIGNSAFEGCRSLRSIDIPNSVTSIGSYAFNFNESLTSIVIPDGVTRIEDCTFSSCYNLSQIIIPDSITYVGWDAFDFAGGLPENLKYNIYDNARYLGNDSNPYVILISGTDENITSCNIHPNTKFIYEDAFRFYSSLTSVTIPNGVTKIGSCSFCGTGLKSIEIPASVTSMEGAFSGCENLTNVKLAEGITTIGAYAFSWCTNSTSITIPKSVTDIGDWAFAFCEKLDSIHFLGDAPSFGGEPADGDPTLVGQPFHETTTTAYYPAGNATWTEDVRQNYGGNITWVSEGSDGNDIPLVDGIWSAGTTVWVDGVAYPVITENGQTQIQLPEDFSITEGTSLVTYDYHVGDADDVHTQYPTGMQVWIAQADEQGNLIPTRIEELDDILQYAGSSIRITGKQGIRMITSIQQSKKNALVTAGLADYKLLEYGTALCWASDLNGRTALTLDQSYVKSNYAYKRGVADPVFKYAGNLMQYTNVLVGFTLDQCKDDIAMRPYMILEGPNGEQVTIYGGIVYRSIGYIAYQNRNAFTPGSDAYKFVWNIIHHVYGNKYDADYKG